MSDAEPPPGRACSDGEEGGNARRTSVLFVGHDARKLVMSELNDTFQISK